MAEPNRMCLPCSWDDECLLLGEPLLSQFAVRKVEGRRKEGLWTQNIARSVMEDKDAHDAAQKWLHIAFSVGPDEPPRPPESLNEETCQIFVRICWLLYDKERARAEGLLKDELLNRGYGLWPSEGEESSEESSDSRATPKSDGKVRGSSGTQDVPREPSTGKRRAVHGALSIDDRANDRVVAASTTASSYSGLLVPAAGYDKSSTAEQTSARAAYGRHQAMSTVQSKRKPKGENATKRKRSKDKSRSFGPVGDTVSGTPLPLSNAPDTVNPPDVGQTRRPKRRCRVMTDLQSASRGTPMEVTVSNASKGSVDASMLETCAERTSTTRVGMDVDEGKPAETRCETAPRSTEDETSIASRRPIRKAVNNKQLQLWMEQETSQANRSKREKAAHKKKSQQSHRVGRQAGVGSSLNDLPHAVSTLGDNATVPAATDVSTGAHPISTPSLTGPSGMDEGAIPIKTTPSRKRKRVDKSKIIPLALLEANTDPSLTAPSLNASRDESASALVSGPVDHSPFAVPSKPVTRLHGLREKQELPPQRPRQPRPSAAPVQPQARPRNGSSTALEDGTDRLMGLHPSFSDISKPLPPSPATDQQRYAENEKKLKGLHFKKRNSREPPEVVSSSIPGQAPVRSTKDISIGRLVSSNVDLRPVSQKILDVWDDWTCKASGEVDEDAPFAADGESKGEAFNGLCLASEDIAHDTPAVPKPCRPRLQNKPVIWAKSRQEVCETLECFRSYQGGVYHIHDLAKGYLLSAFSSNRDVFEHNGKLIISHGGGKAEALHSTKGRSETHAAADQLEGDQSVRALLNTFKANRPLVLLADDKYALFPFDLAAGEYTYVVLGLYRITHAWAELQPAQTNIGRVVRYKFAFQWCEEEDPWWFREKETPAALASGIDNNPLALATCSYPPECGRCQQAFPQVYQDAWMCLNPKCAEFFKVNGEERVLDNLTYASEFLALQPRNIPEVRQSARPPPPPQSNHGIVTTKRFSRGLHCQECGRLSSRYKWEHWECKSCGEIYEVNGQVRSAKDFWYQLEGIPYLQSRIDPRSGVVPMLIQYPPQQGSSPLPTARTFKFPDHFGGGSVHIIPGGALINREADAIFRKYQEQASAGEIQFRRWPLRNHKCRGELLTNYFSQNTGAPYQYVGGADQTVPLETGPSAVRDALALIQKRIAMTLHRHEPFNEVLSAAYMEKQRMAFHSDSEKGLGPVVASLSLGSIAYMHFRLHSQYCREEGSRKVALSLLLRHGDILVMDGAGIQKFYEHTVVPMNFRIVATARNISPENHMA